MKDYWNGHLQLAEKASASSCSGKTNKQTKQKYMKNIYTPMVSIRSKWKHICVFHLTSQWISELMNQSVNQINTVNQFNEVGVSFNKTN